MPATLTGLTAGSWSLWLDSESISRGTSRRQQFLSATQTFDLDAKGYRVYVKGTFPEEEPPAPEVYTPAIGSSSEMALFFETAAEANYQVWAWGGGPTEQQHLGITGGWGERPSMTLMGQAANGHLVYKFIFRGDVAPTNFIITKDGDNPRPYDGAEYVVNGYYVEGKAVPTQVITATGITSFMTTVSFDGSIYNLSGHKVQTPVPGIYIRNGRKFYLSPSELSEPLLLSDKRPSELSEPLLLSDKRPSELSELILLCDKRPSELSEPLLLIDKSPSDRSESLLLTDESPSDCSDLPLTHYERAADCSAPLEITGTGL